MVLFQTIQQHSVMKVTTVNFTEIPRAMTLPRTFALRTSQILGTTSPMKFQTWSLRVESDPRVTPATRHVWIQQ